MITKKGLRNDFEDTAAVAHPRRVNRWLTLLLKIVAARLGEEKQVLEIDGKTVFDAFG